jgi:hypothetical protein
VDSTAGSNELPVAAMDAVSTASAVAASRLPRAVANCAGTGAGVGGDAGATLGVAGEDGTVAGFGWRMTEGIVRAVDAIANVPRRGSDSGVFVLGNVNMLDVPALGVETDGETLEAADGDGTNVFTVRGVRMPRPVPCN